ncbi:hypothetical protein E5288_WYG018170 [Bos mutus]|uniref:Uncharacterized protein n=1 Tax=Bos mutus TaxID=72004 RepID=A0A6B0RIF9_9CETA|nr:hypothetical protein [Bos mutus]
MVNTSVSKTSILAGEVRTPAAHRVRKSLPRQPLQRSAQQASPWNEVVFRVLHTVTQEKNEASFTVSLAFFSSSEKAMPVLRTSCDEQGGGSLIPSSSTPAGCTCQASGCKRGPASGVGSPGLHLEQKEPLPKAGAQHGDSRSVDRSCHLEQQDLASLKGALHASPLRKADLRSVK